MSKISLVVSLLIVLSVHSVLCSQNVVLLDGYVFDQSGSPLVGATVTISPSTKSTAITNSKGYFEFKLPQGKYLIQYHFLGFMVSQDSVRLVNDLTTSVHLQTDTKYLGEVTVRENYENYKNKVEALSVEVVKSDFILENNGTNLIKTLEKLPGVNSMDIGAGYSKPIIRGMGFNRVLVTENGIKQEGQQWGADHGLEIDQFNVQKVELYKGPMSMQFGSDAVGGVIKIISLLPPLENKCFAEGLLISKSVNDLVGLSVMTGMKYNQWFVKCRLTEQHYGDYKIPTDTIVYLTRMLPVYNRRLKNTAGFDRSFFGIMGYYQPTIQTVFAVSNVYQTNGMFPGSHGVPDVNRLQPDGNYRDVDLPNSSVNHFKITNNSQLSFRRWTCQLDVGIQHNHREEHSLFHTHYGTQSAPQVNPDLELQFDLKTYSANFRLQSKNDSVWMHLLGIDTEGQSNSVSGYGFLMPNYVKWAGGLFVIEKYKVSHSVDLTFGVRQDVASMSVSGYYDQFLYTYLTAMNAYSESQVKGYANRSYPINRRFGNATGSLGLVYTPDDYQIFKTNIGRCYRLPSANELSSNGVHHGTYRHEQGTVSLNPELGYQLDMGYVYDNGTLYVAMSPFAGWFSNYIYLNPSGEWSILPHAGQVYKYSQAEVLTAGGECSLDYKFVDDFTFQSAFEYVYLQNLTDGYPLPFSPPMSVLNGLSWHLHKNGKVWRESHVKLECQLVAPQHRIARNEEITPGYDIWGVDVENEFSFGKTKFSISFQINNLFDTKYFNHLSFYRKLNIPEPGRNFQLLIKFPIN